MAASRARQWVLVTGCSQGGLGEALAMAFHNAGVSVIATARNTSKISSDLVSRPNVEVVQLDVTSASSLSSAVERTTEITGGKLDYLINNSGVSCFTPLLDADLDLLRSVMDTNAISIVATAQAFFPLLRAAKGAILNNTSVAGADGVYLPFSGGYSGSKSAAAKLSQVLRVELAPFDVQVVTMFTGSVESEFWTNAKKEGIHTLGESSVYQPIKQEAEHIMSGDFNKNDPAGPWAIDVVRRVVGKSTLPKEIWNGKDGGAMWWMNALFPRWAADMVVNGMSGLGKLKGRLGEAQKDK